MTDLSQFPITARWPAADPTVIQLYSFPTPNGVKASVMLEETGLPYEAHRVTLDAADVKSDAFTSLNPNGRIPALIDPSGPEGTPVEVFESGAILQYLAEKTGRFYGSNAADRARINSWLMWQMGGLGPMTGQLGYFVKWAGAVIEDPRPAQRYADETRRLMGVLDRALEGQDWIAGDYSIADMAIAPWVSTVEYYGARDRVGMDDFANVNAYEARFRARETVQRASNIPPREV